MTKSNTNLGLTLLEADDLFQTALKAHKANNLLAAVEGYLKAIQIEPTNGNYFNSLGAAYRALGRFHDAIACYKHSLILAPKTPWVLSNLGNVYRESGKLEKAYIAQKKALFFCPNNLDITYNLGLVLRDLGQLDEALQLFVKLGEKEPQNAEYEWDYALTLLLMGRLKQGFQRYEVRQKLARNQKRKFKEPLWRGGSLSGKIILVYQEQGYGDTIQFVRYIEKLKHFDCKVFVEVAPQLRELVSHIEGVDLVIKRGEKKPRIDYYIPMLSLPLVFGTDINTVPNKTPYLNVTKKAKFQFFDFGKSSLNIGIAWAGSPSNKNDRHRSCSVKPFIDVLGKSKVDLFSLQMGEAARDLLKYDRRNVVTDLSPFISNFYDTAVITQELDLIITVDTALAHLAGAMAKPVWVLLPFSPDWRWMLDREDSPWYPSMRLFRQPSPQDWESTFYAVTIALKEKLKSIKKIKQVTL